MMDYTLTRSRRRTVAIYINNGGVEVRAPLEMQKRDIDKFVASKERWITEHLAKAMANAK
jgi:predicted metal-dependent hydrolase